MTVEESSPYKNLHTNMYETENTFVTLCLFEKTTKLLDCRYIFLESKRK